MKSFTKILLLVMCLVTFSNAEAAKEKPEFVWSRDVFIMTISDDYAKAEKKREYSLLGTSANRAEYEKQIADAISEKLRAQADKLPFKVKTVMSEGDTSELNAEVSDSSLEKPIAIYPIVVTDYQIPQTYTVNGQNYYKYILISALDIAFCSEDDNGALTILGTIPLHFYKELPESGSSLAAMTEKSQEDLARIYTNFTAQMIEKELDFTKYKKMIEKLADKSLAAETYRVEDVIYTSKTYQQILGGNKLMQRICGNIFTSEYAAHTGNVVYPMILPGDTSNWIVDAQKGLYSAKINSTHSGAKTITMPEKVDHQITLDVRGVGNQEVKTKQVSEINYFELYKVIMRSSISGGKSLETDNYMTVDRLREEVEGKVNRITKSEEEILGTLMIGATVKSAALQAGKKVK